MKYKDMTEAETIRQLEWSDHHEFSYDYAMWSFKKLKEYKKVIDKIKEYIENLLKEEFEITDPDNINYGEKCQRAYFSDSELIKILELLEEIE